MDKFNILIPPKMTLVRINEVSLFKSTFPGRTLAPSGNNILPVSMFSFWSAVKLIKQYLSHPHHPVAKLGRTLSIASFVAKTDEFVQSRRSICNTVITVVRYGYYGPFL